MYMLLLFQVDVNLSSYPFMISIPSNIILDYSMLIINYKDCWELISCIFYILYFKVYIFKGILKIK